MGSFKELFGASWSELLARMVRIESLLGLLSLASTQLLPFLPYVQVFRHPQAQILTLLAMVGLSIRNRRGTD